MAIVGVIGFAVGSAAGGYAAHRWFEVDTLKLKAQIAQKTIDDQDATISALQRAAAQSASLELAERQRARFAQVSIDVVQKETDDAVAAAAANSQHRPRSCDLTPDELGGLRRGLQ
ncbi:hypothetical protein C3941_23755 [Kaistia algarum]|nr:hypothetical protein C3941_23755 [Kaistia algarum]